MRLHKKKNKVLWLTVGYFYSYSYFNNKTKKLIIKVKAMFLYPLKVFKWEKKTDKKRYQK